MCAHRSASQAARRGKQNKKKKTAESIGWKRSSAFCPHFKVLRGRKNSFRDEILMQFIEIRAISAQRQIVSLFLGFLLFES